MDDSITITSRFGRFLSIATAVIVVAGLGAIVISSGWETLLRYGWPLVFVGYVAWALFWQPRLMITGGGVTLYNVIRTVYLPWGAIERIDTKYALTLYTDSGSYAAWAAPAPTRYSVRAVDKQELRRLPQSTYFAETVRPGDLPATDSGQAAQLIRSRWEALKDSGTLDSAFSERRVVTRWHPLTIVGFMVLGAAAVLSVAL